MARTSQQRAKYAKKILDSLQMRMSSQIAVAEDLAANNHFSDAIQVLRQTTDIATNRKWDAERAFNVCDPASETAFLQNLEAPLNTIQQLNDLLAQKIVEFTAAITPVVIDTNIDDKIEDTEIAIDVEVQLDEEVTFDAEASELLTFETAVKKLRALQRQPHPEINRLINELLQRVIELKTNNKSTVMLTQAMNDTYLALIDPTFRDDYHNIAKNMEGKSSTPMKIIGGIMLALSIAIVALGIVFAPVLVSLAPLVFLTAKTVGITIGLTGGAFAVGGFTLFAKSRESGLAKTMHKINNEVTNEAVTYDPIAPAA